MSHGDMDMDMGGGMGACKISMLWNWDTIDACFLAESWHIRNQGMMAASCIGVLLLVVVLEGLRRLGKEYDGFILRQFQREVASRRSTAVMNDNDNGGSAEGAAEARTETRTVVFRASPLQQVIRAVIHAATFGVAYIIMLLAMYFNGYIIISIFIGAGIGKFVCDWMVAKVVVGGGQAADDVPKGNEETTVCCT